MRNVQLRSLLRLPLLLGALGFVAACAGSTGGGTGGGSTSGGAGGAPGGCFNYTGFDGTTPKVTFAADVLPIFRNSCGLSSACHGSQTNPSLPAQHFYGPPVSSPAPTAAQIAAIFAGSVGVKSIDNPDMDVIDPSHPESSFMMYKIDTDPQNVAGVTCSKLTCASAGTCASGMPLTGTLLPAATRDTIRRWIAQGAMND
jgi:hypothetical protein